MGLRRTIPYGHDAQCSRALLISCALQCQPSRGASIVAGLTQVPRKLASHVVVQVELRHLGCVERNLRVDQLSMELIVGQSSFHCRRGKVVGRGEPIYVAVHCWELSDECPYLNP